MSAPRTNIKKQERRHKVPLIGMVIVVGFALVLLALYSFVVAERGTEPRTPDVRNTGTGEVVVDEKTSVDQPGSTVEVEQ
ncbi:MAG: hypothetical protein ACU0AT_05700 [Tranquillimonas sp.]|jgi:hypothetical protein